MAGAFIIAIVLVLFGGPAVLFQLGWVLEFGGAPAYQKLHPSFYFLLPLFLTLLLSSKRSFVFVKRELLSCYLLVLIALIMTFDPTGVGVSLLVNNIGIPVLISGCLILLLTSDTVNAELISKRIRNLLIFFFLVNSLLAVAERILLVNVFLYRAGSGHLLNPWLWGVENFRSSALHNHPLANALLTSTIMLFILRSNLRPLWQFSLYLIGFLALLSFNTRFAIVVMAVYFVGFVCENVFLKVKVKFNHFILLFSGIVVTVLIFYLILYHDFGGRLLSLGFYDNESAGTRVQVFSVFEAINFRILLFGGGSNELSQASEAIGLKHIENFWIIYLFRIGGLFLVLLCTSFSAIMSSYVKVGRRPDLIIVLFFLILISSNNSLAVGVPALSFFILSSFAFLEKKTQILPNS